MNLASLGTSVSGIIQHLSSHDHLISLRMSRFFHVVWHVLEFPFSLHLNNICTMAFPVTQMVKNLPAVQEIWVRSLSGRSAGEGNGNPLRYSCLENPIDRGAWRATVHGVAKSQTRLKRLSGINGISGDGDGNYSSILAWRIPSTEEPGRLLSIGSQRVRHDLSDLVYTHACMYNVSYSFFKNQLSKHHLLNYLEPMYITLLKMYVKTGKMVTTKSCA